MDAAKSKAVSSPDQQPSPSTPKTSASISEKNEAFISPQQTQTVSPPAPSEDTKQKVTPPPDQQPTPEIIQSAASPAENEVIITPAQQKPAIKVTAAGKRDASQKTLKKHKLLWVGIVAFIVLLLTGSGFYFRSYLSNLLPNKQGPQE